MQIQCNCLLSDHFWSPKIGGRLLIKKRLILTLIAQCGWKYLQIRADSL
uniref:Uncharacterized protein n=1 Tax=Anguilla anguilla TaxID=7936 RepID=A0A0E9T2X5_ANGAN